jgi:outer membrane immunogenic protein
MICANTDRARALHRLVALLAFAAPLALAMPVHAADMADDFFTLRGPVSEARVRWDGFQLGGFVGYSNLQSDFTKATRDPLSRMLRELTLQDENHISDWQVLGSDGATGRSYGGYIGYNWQLDGIVVGLDAAYNYTRGMTTTSGPETLARNTVVQSSGTSYNVAITGESMLTLHDWATLRARVGYPMGQFMPYAFAGGAVGRFDYRTTTTVVVVQDPAGTPVTLGPITETKQKTNAISPGVTAGLGVDISLLPNMYLRAEYEFTGFAEMAGIRPTVQTGRVGLGFRF